MKLADFPRSATAAEIQSAAFDFERSPDQDAPSPVRHPVVVVGAGPVGLTLAIDLAQRGQRVLVLDNDARLSTGSRAICFAQRTLQVWDRLGVGDRMADKGVRWNTGRVFFGADELYAFDLQPDAGHERPAFVNLQQYYAEAYLLARALELPNLELRMLSRVVALAPRPRDVVLGIDTPDGRYDIAADHVVACDGSRSPLRAMLGLDAQGRTFRDRFLIADVKMTAPFPAERWFWFDPPFHRNQSVRVDESTLPSSVLLHRQPDDVWRIDFQLGWDADPETEKRPERIVPRVRALLGADVPFTLEWASVYTFSCQRMASFRHGRVLFAGDAAHGVSPFGARGANSGVQDADNLGWKLDRVLRGEADDALLHSYAVEREAPADENIRHSTRATDFITPKSAASRRYRDAVLALARKHAFARQLVNSGRLSTATTLHGSPLSTADVDGDFAGAMVPGAAAVDAPLRIAGRPCWWLRLLGGDSFTLLVWGVAPRWAAGLDGVRVQALDAGNDPDGCLAHRYDLKPGTAYLLRPDQHVAARWRAPTEAGVRAAWARACALH